MQAHANHPVIRFVCFFLIKYLFTSFVQIFCSNLLSKSKERSRSLRMKKMTPRERRFRT